MDRGEKWMLKSSYKGRLQRFIHHFSSQVSAERHSATKGFVLSSGLSIQFMYLYSPKFGV